MSHAHQLALSEGLQPQRTITDAVATDWGIVTRFKHSSLTYSKLHAIQEELGQLTKRLQQYVPTRWNSTFYYSYSRNRIETCPGLHVAEHELQAVLATN